MPLTTLDNQTTEVEFDISGLRFITPVGVVLWICWIRFFEKIGVTWTIVGVDEQADIYRYLQRIDFFSTIGVETVESFVRRPSRRRFIPIENVGRASQANVNQLASRAAECISPDPIEGLEGDYPGYLNCLKFGISELVNNVSQHASGMGCIMAQYFPRFDSVTVAVADIGMGIRESFHMVRYEQEHEVSHLKSLQQALLPLMSSKKGTLGWGESVNQGVGLTLLAEIAEACGGEFCILSGDGMVHNRVGTQLDGMFFGTLVAYRFNRDRMHDFAAVLEVAKQNSGLDDSSGAVNKFFG